MSDSNQKVNRDGFERLFQQSHIRYFYNWKWLADKVLREASEADGGRDKEFWVMLMYGTNIKSGDVRRRMLTHTELRMASNLAMACGATGIQMYKMNSTSTSFDGLDYDALDNSPGWERQPYSQVYGDNPPHSREWINQSLLRENICDNNLYPFDYIRELYTASSPTGIKDALKLLRHMRWVNATNMHPDLCTDLLEGNTPYLTSYSNPLSYHFDRTINGQVVTIPVSGTFTDEVRTGLGQDAFHLRSVFGTGVHEASVDNEVYDDLLANNYNVYVGLFKWDQEDPDAEYYYVVNTTCNKYAKERINDADNADIRLRFRHPNDGRTWALYDRLTNDQITLTYNSGLNLYETPNLTFLPGGARLLKYAPVQTQVSGHITSDATWSGSLLMTGTVYVDAGVTLTIAPGTAIRVRTGSLIVNSGGRLLINGSSGEGRVTFRPEALFSGTSYPWLGIGIYDGPNASSHRISGTDIEGAHYGVQTYPTAGQNGDDVLSIYDSNIHRCQYGIVLGAMETTIANTDVSYCTDGVLLNSDRYHVTLDHVHADRNQYGVYALGSSSSSLDKITLKSCLVENSLSYGLLATNLDLEMTGLRNDPTVIRYNGYGLQTQTSRSTYAGTCLNGAAVCRFNNTQIVENAGWGLYTTNAASMLESAENDAILIANNSLQTANAGQIYISSNSSLEMKKASFDIYMNDNYFIPGSCDLKNDGDTLDASDNYWGSDIGAPTQLFTNNLVSGILTITSVRTSPGDETHHYWQIGGDTEESVAGRLTRIYSNISSGTSIDATESELNSIVADKKVYATIPLVCLLSKYRGVEIAEEALQGWLGEEWTDPDRVVLLEQYASLLADQGKLKDACALLLDSDVTEEAPKANLDIYRLELMLAAELRQNPLNASKVAALQEKLNELHTMAATLAAEGTRQTSHENVPTKFTLHPLYPNPTNGMVNITYYLPEARHVTADVFNVLGERVARLVDGNATAGTNRLSWDFNSQAEKAVTSGVYFIVVRAGGAPIVRKVALVK